MNQARNSAKLSSQTISQPLKVNSTKSSNNVTHFAESTLRSKPGRPDSKKSLSPKQKSISFASKSKIIAKFPQADCCKEVNENLTEIQLRSSTSDEVAEEQVFTKEHTKITFFMEKNSLNSKVEKIKKISYKIPLSRSEIQDITEQKKSKKHRNLRNSTTFSPKDRNSRHRIFKGKNISCNSREIRGKRNLSKTRIVKGWRMQSTRA